MPHKSSSITYFYCFVVLTIHLKKILHIWLCASNGSVESVNIFSVVLRHSCEAFYCWCTRVYYYECPALFITCTPKGVFCTEDINISENDVNYIFFCIDQSIRNGKRQYCLWHEWHTFMNRLSRSPLQQLNHSNYFICIMHSNFNSFIVMLCLMSFSLAPHTSSSKDLCSCQSCVDNG